MALGTYHGRLLLSPDKSALKDCCCERDWVVFTGCLTSYLPGIIPIEYLNLNFDSPFYLPTQRTASAPSVMGVLGICLSDNFRQTAVSFTELFGETIPEFIFSLSVFGHYPTQSAARKVVDNFLAGLDKAVVCGCGCQLVPSELYHHHDTLYGPGFWTRIGDIVVPATNCGGRPFSLSFYGWENVRLTYGGGSWLNNHVPAGKDCYLEGLPPGTPSYPAPVECYVELSVGELPPPDCGPEAQALIASVPRNGEELGALDLTNELLGELG